MSYLVKRRVLVLLGVFVLLLLLGEDARAQNEPIVSSPVREVIVVFKKRPTTSTILSVTSQNTNITLENGITSSNAMVFSVASGSAVSETIASLSQNQNVEAVFPNQKVYLFAVPNDELIKATPVSGQPRKQWNMFNLKLAGDGQTAWDKTTGSGNVVVAVIDSGVDSTHPDLAGKLVSFVDCFVKPCQERTTMTDEAGHGTHVTGLIAAATNNSIGMAGAGYNTKVMVIKMMNAQGVGDLDNLMEAIIWAADHGAKVINMSLGAVEENLDSAIITLLNNKVSYAWGKGVLLVAAAGNCGGNTQGDKGCAIRNEQETVTGYAKNSKSYPGASPNVLSVAALKVDNTRASYSNYNDASNAKIGNWISAAAPGGEYTSETDASNGIVSTIPANKYAYNQGTSMASPQVAGVAALLFAVNPNLTNAQVKTILETTADKGVAQGATNNGAIDALAAVNSAGGAATPTATPGAGTPSVTPPATPAVSPTPSLSPTPTPPKLPKTPPSPMPTGPFCPPSTNCDQKVLGDANCDGKIDERDYAVWKQQFDTMAPPLPINYNANFSCKETHNFSQFVDMIDYEIWRRNKTQ